MFDDDILAAAAALLQQCRTAKLMLATAESCTGGLIAAALTEIAGSSDVVDRGFVTYSNAAKTAMLGVPPDLIAQFGAVSEPVAGQMARGAVINSVADIAVSVTGVAGPGGGSPEKPVGTVWFATFRRNGEIQTDHQLFPGDRSAVRRATLLHALTLVSARSNATP